MGKIGKRKLIKASIGFGGIVCGLLIGYLLFFYFSPESKNINPSVLLEILPFNQKQVIGFLPYWLLNKAKPDYSSYINNLTYFGLTVDTNGKILKFEKPGESEPGWYTLNSGKADSFLTAARNKGLKLSLLIFNANESSIEKLIEDPIPHAQNLVEDIKPIMKQYGFKDLNLDIESTHVATDGARLRFNQFVQEVKRGVDQNHLGTLTLEVSGDTLIKKRLINITEVARFVDYVVLMAYDYHYTGSQVTGPVAPLFGAGEISEYDTQAAVEEALKVIPSKKLILGLPLYGYEWETLRESTRSATIPSSGLTASTGRVEKLINSCSSCSAQTDTEKFHHKGNQK